MNFYLQDYTTGSAIVIATPDAKTYYVFQDADATDGIYADESGGSDRHLTMVFGESLRSSLSPINQCFAAPYGSTPATTALVSLKTIGSENNCSPSTIINSLAMTFVCIPEGTFTMGSPLGEPGQNINENPQHQVTISDKFYLQTREVTVAEFRSFVEASGYQTEAEKNGGMLVSRRRRLEQKRWCELDQYRPFAKRFPPGGVHFMERCTGLRTMD